MMLHLVVFKSKIVCSCKIQTYFKRETKNEKKNLENNHVTKRGSPNHPDLAAFVRMILKMILV